MPVVGVEFLIKGSPRAEHVLDEFLSRIENLVGMGPHLHAYLAKWQKEVFETQGAKAGRKWPGYTGSERLYGTIKRMLIGRKYGKRLLRWAPGRERLFPSLVSFDHPEHVWELNKKGKFFEFGTKVPYAANHQFGRGRGPAWAGFPKIKARPFLNLTKKQVADIRRMMARYVGAHDTAANLDAKGFGYN